jgi:hypothetical protein
VKGRAARCLRVGEDRESAPVRFIEVSGKLRNGLYIRGVCLHDDHVAFDVFASRPIEISELADLSLTDDAGTQYARL